MKIGIFLSRDNGIISDTIDVDALADEYSGLAVERFVTVFFLMMISKIF